MQRFLLPLTYVCFLPIIIISDPSDLSIHTGDQKSFSFRRAPLYEAGGGVLLVSRLLQPTISYIGGWRTFPSVSREVVMLLPAIHRCRNQDVGRSCSGKWHVITTEVEARKTTQYKLAHIDIMSVFSSSHIWPDLTCVLAAHLKIHDISIWHHLREWHQSWCQRPHQHHVSSTINVLSAPHQHNQCPFSATSALVADWT